MEDNKLIVNFNKSWKELLKDEFDKDYFKTLLKSIEYEYKKKGKDHIIYPPKREIFKTFETTDVNDIKVIILLKECNKYTIEYKKNELINLLKESGNKIKIDNETDEIDDEIDEMLDQWSKKGILILNCFLTYKMKKDSKVVENLHKYIGWSAFTDTVINLLSKKNKNLVFMLFGSYISNKEEEIYNNDDHCVLVGKHPGSFDFEGKEYFKTACEYIKLKRNVDIKFIIGLI